MQPVFVHNSDWDLNFQYNAAVTVADVRDPIFFWKATVLFLSHRWVLLSLNSQLQTREAVLLLLLFSYISGDSNGITRVHY